MQIIVKFFAILKDRTGLPETRIILADGSTAETAKAKIIELFPVLQSFLPRVAIAINREYVSSGTVLRDGDELALIPPVSGG